MKLLVCGGRDFDDVDFVVDSLCDLHETYPITHVIAGGAKGADTFAVWWAEEMDIPFTVYKAEWHKYGKKAGYIRNKQMLDEGQPDAVYAFAGGRGTADMVSQSEARGIDVYASSKILFNSKIKQYEFLSNFYTGFPFHDEDGVLYKSSEHYFQSHKTPIESERSIIQMADTPLEAKSLSKTINLYKDWDTRRLDVMRDAIRLKFPYDSEAANMLMDTLNDYLMEYAPWETRGVPFWGVNKTNIGHNYLGKILMERRSVLFDHC